MSTDNLNGTLSSTGNLNGTFGTSGGGGTSNYNDLTNKPQINGNTLEGNKTPEQLGINIPDMTNYYNKSETNTLLDGKANVSDLPDMNDYYDKSETDTLLDSKVNNSSFNAASLPITSGSATDTKSYIDTEKVANTASYLYQPTVTEPTLSVGTNHNNRTWYYKHGTRVCLSIGLRDLSVGLVNQDIFTLPIGYRPRKPLSMIVCGYSFDKHSAIMITDTGIVRAAYTQDQGAFGYIEFDAYS